MNSMIRKKLTIITFCIVGALSTACGKLTGDLPNIGGPGGNLSLANAPATTDILVQTYEQRTNPYPGSTVTVRALKLVTAAEFDAEKAKPNTDTTKKIYTFVGRALSNPASGTFELRDYWTGTQSVRYALHSGINPQPNTTRAAYVYSSAQGYFTGSGNNVASNGLTPLYEYAGGWTVNSNMGGQPIAYIFYTTDQDKQLGRNQ